MTPKEAENLRHFHEEGYVIVSLDVSASDRAIVSAVISMAHGMNLRVTAEGVETDAQLAFLRERGCEEVQGFLMGRPAPV